MDRTRTVRTWLLLLILVLAPATPGLWGQYLGPVGSFRPPVQSQMPHTGATRRTYTNLPRQNPFASSGPSLKQRADANVASQYIPPVVSGRDMASWTTTRALTRGIRF